jgi:hypothetical protein
VQPTRIKNVHPVVPEQHRHGGCGRVAECS